MGGFSTAPQYQSGLGHTERVDAWWVQPLVVAFTLTLFGVYATWAALQGAHYQFGSYLSPFYSPLIVIEQWHWSPAFLILWIPLGFRATCYYYRKAYYRSFFLIPPACAVGKRTDHYQGETRFPFILQNIHRYFLYLAIVVIAFLWHDVYKAFWFEESFGVGVGTVVLFLNTLFLSFYTFSCHSFRHFVGGGLKTFSKGEKTKSQYNVWCAVSCLNAKHMAWAWISLWTVGLADLYVRLCSMGVITDIRLF